MLRTYKIKDKTLSVEHMEALKPEIFNGCVLILRGNIYNNDSLKDLLSKILGAIGIDFNKSLVLNIEKDKLHIKEIKNIQGISLLFGFGTHPKEINLNLIFEPYYVMKIGDIKMCFSASLSDLKENINLKQKLWKALKSLKA